MSWNCGSCREENLRKDNSLEIATGLYLLRCPLCGYLAIEDDNEDQINSTGKVRIGEQILSLESFSEIEERTPVILGISKLNVPIPDSSADLPAFAAEEETAILPTFPADEETAVLQVPPGEDDTALLSVVPVNDEEGTDTALLPAFPDSEEDETAHLPSYAEASPETHADAPTPEELPELPVADLLPKSSDDEIDLAKVEIPPGAKWIEDDGVWEVGAHKSGKRQGEFKYWRKDGTLAQECTFADGTEQGTYKRFHENGEVSQAGDYEDGKLNGKRFFYRTKGRSTEEFPQGLPDEAWVYAMNYDHGLLVGGEAYNDSKQRICMDGSLFPERPSSVPRDAGFNEKEEIWFTGAFDSDAEDRQKTGIWQYWTKEGALFREVNYELGQLDGLCREYSEDGYLKVEGNYAHDREVGIWKEWQASGAQKRIWEYNEGKLHGTETIFDENGEFAVKNKYRVGMRTEYFALLRPDEFYGLRNVHSVRGQYQNNQVAGLWKYFDADEEILRQFDYGSFRGSEFFWSSEVMQDTDYDAEKLKEIKALLEANEDIYGLFVTAVREAVLDKSSQPIFRFLLTYCPPFTPDVSKKKAAEFLANHPDDSTLSHDRIKESILHAIGLAFIGGDSARMIHFAAKRLHQIELNHLAYVFINAANFLTPNNRQIREDLETFTQGLGRFSELTEPTGQKNAAKEATPLERYTALLAESPFDFWPNSESIRSKLVDEPYEMKIELNLIQISELMNSLLLSLQKRRNQVLEQMEIGREASWMIPDFSSSLDFYSKKEIMEAPVVLGGEYEDDYLTNLRWAHEEWVLLVLMCYACGMEEVGRIGEIGNAPELSSLNNFFIELSHECEETKELGEFPLDFEFEFAGIKFHQENHLLLVDYFAPVIQRILDTLKWLSGEIEDLRLSEGSGHSEAA